MCILITLTCDFVRAKVPLRVRALALRRGDQIEQQRDQDSSAGGHRADPDAVTNSAKTYEHVQEKRQIN